MKCFCGYTGHIHNMQCVAKIVNAYVYEEEGLHESPEKAQYAGGQQELHQNRFVVLRL